MPKDILYVEDNADHAELVLRHLERRKLRDRVIHVEDGERALAHLDRVEDGEAVSPCVVLLDLRLPRIDGIQVLERVKHTPALREIPVVIFSTSSADPDIRQAYENYANSYLVKPDDSLELNSLLDELSHYWLATNRRRTG